MSTFLSNCPRSFIDMRGDSCRHSWSIRPFYSGHYLTILWGPPNNSVQMLHVYPCTLVQYEPSVVDTTSCGDPATTARRCQMYTYTPSYDAAAESDSVISASRNIELNLLNIEVAVCGVIRNQGTATASYCPPRCLSQGLSQHKGLQRCSNAQLSVGADHLEQRETRHCNDILGHTQVSPLTTLNTTIRDDATAFYCLVRSQDRPP